MSNTEENIKNNTNGNIQQSEVDKPTVVESVTTKKEDIKKDSKKSKDEKNGLTKREELLMRGGQGVNLVPKKSEEEIEKEQKKFSFSVGSIVSLILLVTLSLGVVLYNIISKGQLNSAKKQLFEQEVRLESYQDKYISNQEIMDRIDLYKKFEKAVFSPKEIIDYIMALVDKSGDIDINGFDLDESLNVEISGSTSTLGIVSKLWYLLGTDKNIVTVNLSSVGKNEEGVSFSFEIQLDTEYFTEN
jgi:hypothetical protein